MPLEPGLVCIHCQKRRGADSNETWYAFRDKPRDSAFVDNGGDLKR
jgi:hypothetical protein